MTNLTKPIILGAAAVGVSLIYVLAANGGYKAYHEQPRRRKKRPSSRLKSLRKLSRKRLQRKLYRRLQRQRRKKP